MLTDSQQSREDSPTSHGTCSLRSLKYHEGPEPKTILRMTRDASLKTIEDTALRTIEWAARCTTGCADYDRLCHSERSEESLPKEHC